MRAVFFGTPELSVPSLRALAALADVAGVVTQPDRPAGRGLAERSPAVKLAARELGLEVYQPQKVRDGALAAWLRERAPDVSLVIAYGRILPPEVLQTPRAGCLNLHASLLPKYRGAAPINWAIVRGERETGITLMKMDAGLDTGPVLSRHAIVIGPEETAGELALRIAGLAAEVVRADLARAVRGELQPEPQDERAATLAPPIRREDCRVDFGASAENVARLVRGMAPRPGAFTKIRGKVLRLHRVRAHEAPAQGAPGTLSVAGGAPLVATGRGAVEIVSAQLEGRRETAGRDLVNGRVLTGGLVLGGDA